MGWAVLQQQYSGVGLFCSSSIVGWGCFAAVQHFCVLQAIRQSMPLLYAADTGNDYYNNLAERRDGAVSKIVFISVLLRHVMAMHACPRASYNTCTRDAWNILPRASVQYMPYRSIPRAHVINCSITGKLSRDNDQLHNFSV